MSVSANVISEICDNDNGQILITVSGTNGPFTFLWNTGETTQNISGLSEGTYTVTVIGSNDCSIIESFTVPNTITLDLNSVASNETCGNSDGSIDISINASAGTPTFLWNTGDITEDLIDIPAGIYTCMIEDEAGCNSNVYHEIINETGDMLVIPTVTNDLCGLGGSVVLDISGTPAGYTVLWSNGETQPSIYNLTAGTYSVEVTDNSNGCMYYGSFVIESIGNYSVNASIINSSCEICNDGSIDLSLNPVDTYTFNWSNGAETEDLNNLLPGIYSVQISNPLSCIYEEIFSVNFEVAREDINLPFIQVFPNPANDWINIVSNGFNENAFIKISNITGSIVFESERTAVNNTIPINISNFAPGIYIISIESGSFIRSVKLFKLE
jgi:hypothetical protein